MSTLETIWNDIVSPREEFVRTEALRELVALRRAPKPPEVPPEIAAFLAEWITPDRLQAALAGLVLATIEPRPTFTNAMRIFPILFDPFEPALVPLAVHALRFRSPEGLYRSAVLLTADRDAPPVDAHYAAQIASSIRYDDLLPAFEDYLPKPPRHDPAAGG